MAAIFKIMIFKTNDPSISGFTLSAHVSLTVGTHTQRFRKGNKEAKKSKEYFKQPNFTPFLSPHKWSNFNNMLFNQVLD